MIPPENRPAFPSRTRARLAAIVWAVLTMSLLAAAIFVQPATSALLPAAAQAQAARPFEDEEDSDPEEEVEGDAEEFECEEDEEEECEEEDEEELGSKGPLLLPPDCLLRTAEAQVTASTVHDLLSLTIHYTAPTPTNVSVDYWLKGSKGSLQFKETKQHFSQQGVFRDGEHLSDRAMSKVRAARTFVVQLGIPAAPDYCSRYSTQRLTVKHMASNRATWSRPN